MRGMLHMWVKTLFLLALLFFRLNFYGPGIIHEQHAHSSADHENSRKDNRINRLIVINMLNHRSTGQSVDDLRYRDEEIEYAHVDPNLSGRERTGKDHVWHRENTSPGDPNTDHRKDKEFFV